MVPAFGRETPSTQLTWKKVQSGAEDGFTCYWWAQVANKEEEAVIESHKRRLIEEIKLMREAVK